MPAVINPMYEQPEQEMIDTKLNIRYPRNNVVKILQNGRTPYWELIPGRGNYRILWNDKAKAVVANEYPEWGFKPRRYTYNTTTKKTHCCTCHTSQYTKTTN